MQSLKALLADELTGTSHAPNNFIITVESKRSCPKAFRIVSSYSCPEAITVIMMKG